MSLDYLAKRLYPKVPSGRRIYQLKMLLVSIVVGLVLGGVVVALTLLKFGGGH